MINIACIADRSAGSLGFNDDNLSRDSSQENTPPKNQGIEETQDSRDGEDKNSEHPSSQSSRNRKQKRAILTPPPKKALLGQNLISDFLPITKSLKKSARASLSRSDHFIVS